MPRKSRLRPRQVSQTRAESPINPKLCANPEQFQAHEHQRCRVNPLHDFGIIESGARDLEAVTVQGPSRVQWSHSLWLVGHSSRWERMVISKVSLWDPVCLRSRAAAAWLGYANRGWRPLLPRPGAAALNPVPSLPQPVQNEVGHPYPAWCALFSPLGDHTHGSGSSGGRWSVGALGRGDRRR